VLCRSLEVWKERLAVNLPTDIRPLIEATYAEREEQEHMARWLHELDKGTTNPKRLGRIALRQLASIGLATDGKTLPEAHAQTRYSESDSFEVLLLRGLEQIPDEKASRLVLLDGSALRLPQRRDELTKAQWKTLTARLMQQTVQVRPKDAPAQVARDTLEKYGLQHCFYLGDPNWAEDVSLLRLALVDDTSTLRGLHGAPVHDKYSLEYRDDLGYRALKI
jgi:CRISPR-associated endonuclease/helicase Cas3